MPSEGSDEGKGSLFARSGIHFWDPSIGAFYLAIARAETGNTRGADQLLGQIDNYYQHLLAVGLNQPGILYQLARIKALEGETEDALALLWRAVDGGWRFWYTGDDPAFKNLNGQPEFEAIVEEIDALVDVERKRFLRIVGTDNH